MPLMELGTVGNVITEIYFYPQKVQSMGTIMPLLSPSSLLVLPPTAFIRRLSIVVGTVLWSMGEASSGRFWWKKQAE